MTPRQGGGLWVGSDGGLSSYVDGRFQHIAGPRGHENDPVRSVLEDRQHVLWVGTEGAGAYRLDQHGMTVFDRRNGLSGNSVKALVEGRDGRIWIGTNEGVDVIEQGKVVSMRSLLPVSQPVSIHLIHEDRAGRALHERRGDLAHLPGSLSRAEHGLRLAGAELAMVIDERVADGLTRKGTQCVEGLVG
jgi:hypothetical protein